jgi:hypothetical protein
VAAELTSAEVGELQFQFFLLRLSDGGETGTQAPCKTVADSQDFHIKQAPLWGEKIICFRAIPGRS